MRRLNAILIDLKMKFDRHYKLQYEVKLMITLFLTIIELECHTILGVYLRTFDYIKQF